MGHGIERRLKRDLFAFVVASREYYETLGRYAPSETRYPDFVQTLLESGWEMTREGIWHRVIPESILIPEKGFKIHISATSKTAAEVLEKVVPVCLEARVPFKFLADRFLLDFANSKNYSRSSSGKFITIYPQDLAACGSLLERLHQATRDLSGPYILSDRPYKDSKVVFYRYGGFLPRFQLNLFGERVPVMQSSDGSLVPDLRNAYFELPAGIEDPFAEPEEAPGSSTILLNQRYAIDAPLRFSNSGGVYLAEDRKTGARVVVKEARPCVNLTESNPLDAIATLQKEARVLQALQGTPYVPRFIDCFQEWKHHFLVEEYVEGLLLSSFRALEDFGLLVQRTITVERVADFCRRFGRLAQNLIEAVQEFHRRDIIIGDLSPTNILVDRETLAVTLLDFEGAFVGGENLSLLDVTVTTGFVSERRLNAKPPTFTDDFYSLGAVLYSVIMPVQEFFPLNPDAQKRFLEEILRDFDLPSEVGTLIVSLREGDVGRAREAAGILVQFRPGEWRPQMDGKARTTEAELRETLRRIGDHILASMDLGRDDRLFPADYRVFTSNALNVSYGALGVALFLKELLGQVPEDVQTWVSRRPLDPESYPSGLFVGLSGIAWALAEIAGPERAAGALDLALSSPLAYQGPDIFFGTAGLGLGCLYFWGRTAEPRFLEKARDAAEALVQTARADESGYYWINADGGHYYGYAHGGSGIAFFFLKLYQATRDSRYLAYAKGALEYEIARAVEKDDYVVWHRSADDPLKSPYWRYGTAGVGSVLVRFHAALGEERYLQLAKRAARYVAAKYAVFPGQFIGLSGMGEFLLDMYLYTGEPRYLDDAWRIMDGALLFQVPGSRGVAFPGEELIRLSTDYGTGSAGIGLFASRLLKPGPRLFYDFDLPGGISWSR